MGDKSRISPEQSFPEDLAPLEDREVEILNSKVNRQLDLEYTEDKQPDPETESRYEELKAELDFRADEYHQPPADLREAHEQLTQVAAHDGSSTPTASASSEENAPEADPKDMTPA